MILTVRNDFAHFRIECPDDSQITADDDTDFLVVHHARCRSACPTIYCSTPHVPGISDCDCCPLSH